MTEAVPPTPALGPILNFKPPITLPEGALAMILLLVMTIDAAYRAISSRTSASHGDNPSWRSPLSNEANERAPTARKRLCPLVT